MDPAPLRFKSLSVEEKANLLDNIESDNTKRGTATAVKLFRSYLNEKNLDLDFENYSKTQLDDVLETFYMESRNKKGDMYKKSTLMAYRHGIQRHLEQTRTDIDITKGDDFKKSNRSFKCVTKELKKQGLAVVNHHPSITDDDLERMYGFLTTDNLEDPQLLQYKVNIL